MGKSSRPLFPVVADLAAAFGRSLIGLDARHHDNPALPQQTARAERRGCGGGRYVCFRAARGAVDGDEGVGSVFHGAPSFAFVRAARAIATALDTPS